VGSCAVDWCLEYARDECHGTRSGASGLLQRMLEKGFFKHVADADKQFIDGFYFYRFKDDEGKNLNEFIPWTTAREAWKVSVDLLTRITKIYLNHTDLIKDGGSFTDIPEFRDFAVSTCELQKVVLKGISSTEMLCFWVNIYNTLALHAHAQFHFTKTALRGLSFFSKVSYEIGGLKYSLLTIEHSILRCNLSPPRINLAAKLLKSSFKLKNNDERKQYIVVREPLINFAINCGASSQPIVRVLRPDNLYETLKKAAADYLTQKIFILEESSRIEIPQLLEWYLDDFGKDNREAWINLGKLSRDDVINVGISRMLRKELKKVVRGFNWDYCPQLEKQIVENTSPIQASTPYAPYKST